MRARWLMTFFIAVSMEAQPNPSELLRLVQAKVAGSLDRISKYMCTQTIDRVSYEPDVKSGNTACDAGSALATDHMASSDRLRLDVAMTSTGEIYAWVGSSRFDDRDLLDMVGEGAISTGNFAGFLTMIFRTDDANFTYNGDSAVDGRALSEFGFRVPYERSHYRFGVRPHQTSSGYDGTLLVDAKTGDLVRLAVATSRLPVETGVCNSTTTMNYTQVHLGDNNILLPAESRLRIVDVSGAGSENHTVFSACHEFLGESSISFDSPTNRLDSAVHRPDAPHPLVIPAGLRFQLALTQEINTTTAAAGDPVTAKLITPIKNSSKVLVSPGAAVAGRILRLRRYYGNDASVTLDVKLDTVDVLGTAIPLIATPVGGSFQKAKKGILQRRVEIGTLRGLEDRSARYVFRDMHQPYTISSLVSTWVTVNPPDGKATSTPTK